MYVESHFGWRSKIILPIIRPMTRASPLTGIIRISSPSDKESLNISCQGCLLTLCFDNVIPSLSDSLRDSILHQKANHFRVMGTWVQTTAVSSWPQLGVLGCLFFRTRPSPPSWLKIVVESWGGNFSVSASSPFPAPSVIQGQWAEVSMVIGNKFGFPPISAISSLYHFQEKLLNFPKPPFYYPLAGDNNSTSKGCCEA